MHAKNREALASRVANAAAAALQRQGFVAPIDVMMGIGWLAPSHVSEWQTLRLPSLDAGIQTNLAKVADALRLFAAWAQQAGLQPSTADYVARTASREQLRFSQSGNPAIEATWRTHWASPQLTASRRARIEAKSKKAPELVAIEARHPDWRCHRCGGNGELLVMEPPGPACLRCAGLGELTLVPAGNALLTRRARAASKLTALVMRWSNTRNHYERIGTLVEPAALASAQASIQRDAD